MKGEGDGKFLSGLLVSKAQTPVVEMGGCGSILSTEKPEEGLGVPAVEGTLETVTKLGNKMT